MIINIFSLYSKIFTDLRIFFRPTAFYVKIQFVMKHYLSFVIILFSALGCEESQIEPNRPTVLPEVRNLQILLGELHTDQLEIAEDFELASSDFLFEKDYLRIYPNDDFDINAASFGEITFRGINSSNANSTTIDVQRQSTDCTRGGAPDYISIGVGESGIINLLDNDGICWGKRPNVAQTNCLPLETFLPGTPDHEIIHIDVLAPTIGGMGVTTINVPEGTKPGTYEVVYEICFKIGPARVSEKDLENNSSCDYYTIGVLTVEVTD